MHRPGRARRLAAAALTALVLLPAGPVAPARASRSALDGRSLPRLLAVDDSNLRTFPGSGTWFEPRMDLEYAQNGYTTFVSGSIAGISTSNPANAFVMALGGAGTRVGYILDGRSHNLLVSFPGGWGLTAGFQDRFERFQDENLNVLGDAYRYETGDEENWERDFRLGGGWSHRAASGRAVQIGIAATLVHAEGTNEDVEIQDDELTVTRLGWTTREGLGGEFAVQSVTPEPGFQFAAAAYYQDLRPRFTNITGLRARRRGATLDLGWRLHPRHVDDAVIGFSAGWNDTHELSVSSTAREVHLTTYQGLVFASLETGLGSGWTARAGVRGPIRFAVEETTTPSGDSETPRFQIRRESGGSIADPEVVLGGGWLWRAVTVDAYLGSTVYLYNPFVRWAASLAW